MHDATTILVIEDEEILRESMADYLEDRNFRVVTAENGRIGLEVFVRESPDLVLTDLRMPELDGLDVLRRAGELSPDTPMIVVSGTGNISDSIQALRLGAWDYILKPVEDMSILALAADKALERARLRRENREYHEHLEALVRERTAELERANTELTTINARLRHVVDTTRRLSVCAEMDQFGPTLLDEFALHMGASGGSIFLLEDAAGLRRLATLEPDHVPEFIPFPLPEGSILRRAIEGGQSLLIHNIAQEHTVTPSGWDGYRDGSALLFPLPDDAGRVVGVMTLHSKNSPPFVEQDKDIGTILASYSCETLRAIRATETLRASEARFRDLADMLPEAVFETDRNLELIYANQRAFELFGYAANDLSKRLTMLDLVLSCDRDRAQFNIARRSRGENPGTVEYQAVKKDGSAFPVLFHASAIMQDDELCGFRGIVIDITERKRMEQALRESEAHYRTLFESLPIPVFTKNCEGKYTSSNAENQKYWPASPIGRSDVELLKPAAAAALRKSDLRVIESGESLSVEEHFVHTPSGERYMLARKVPLRDDGGTITGILGASLDITERKHAEEALHILNEELELRVNQRTGELKAINKELQDFAYIVSHDLKAPLRGINQLAHWLHEDYADALGKQGQEQLDLLVGRVKRLDALIDGVLRYSRATRGSEHAESVELHALVSQVIDMLVPPAHITIRIQDELPIVPGDPTQLTQVFQNLLSNAVQFMDKEIGTITITCKDSGEFWTFGVEDNGSGIEARHHERIFQIFQACVSRDERESTGIGLTVVKKIVESRGGRIRVESTPGRGSRFLFTWPKPSD